MAKIRVVNVAREDQRYKAHIVLYQPAPEGTDEDEVVLGESFVSIPLDEKDKGTKTRIHDAGKAIMKAHIEARNKRRALTGMELPDVTETEEG